MKHLQTLTRGALLPARADSLLVKQAQLTVLGQAVEILSDISALVKEIRGE
jgi:hypothetical protein